MLSKLNIGDRVLVTEVSSFDTREGIKGDMLGTVHSIEPRFINVLFHTGKGVVVHPLYPSQIKKF